MCVGERRGGERRVLLQRARSHTVSDRVGITIGLFLLCVARQPCDELRMDMGLLEHDVERFDDQIGRERVCCDHAGIRPPFCNGPTAATTAACVVRQPEINRLDEVRRGCRPATPPHVERAQEPVALLRARVGVAAVCETLLKRRHRLVNAELHHERAAELRPNRKHLGELDGRSERLDRRLGFALCFEQRRHVDVGVVRRWRGRHRSEGHLVVLLRLSPVVELEQAPAYVVVDDVALEGRWGW